MHKEGCERANMILICSSEHGVERSTSDLAAWLQSQIDSVSQGYSLTTNNPCEPCHCGGAQCTNGSVYNKKKNKYERINGCNTGAALLVYMSKTTGYIRFEPSDVFPAATTALPATFWLKPAATIGLWSSYR